MNINKWKKAAIHIECATDSEHYIDRIKRIEELQKQHKEGKISFKEYADAINENSNDIRFSGTAIFLKYNNKRYLITAKHVVWDELSAKREYEHELERNPKMRYSFRQYLNGRIGESSNNRIFHSIFKVPSIDEVIQGYNLKSLPNLGAGPSYVHPYTFSSEHDLAIISLDKRNADFADSLQENGYIPITDNDLGSEPNIEGEEIFTVGFPGATSLIMQLQLPQKIKNYVSSNVSEPIFSFGKVALQNHRLDFFWTDMSIYPGNSGGPVILNDKLVGVVSSQAVIGIENTTENLKTRIPFGKIIKAKHIHELLQIQVEKEERKE